MAFRVFFTVVLLLPALIISAQENKVDSLESLVNFVPSDTNKVWLLNTLVAELREKDNNKALTYAIQARDLAELLQYKKGLAQAMEDLGWIYYRKGDYTESFDLSAKALKLNEELGNRTAGAKCLITIAAIHYEQTQYIEAIKHFRQVRQISIEEGDFRTLARSLNNIAFCYLHLKNTDSAYYYITRAVAASESVGDIYLKAFAIRTMGDVYEVKQQYDRAIESYRTCLNLSATEGNTFLKVSTLHRIGKMYKYKGEYEKAIQYLAQNLSIAGKYGFRDELERTFKLLSEIYHERNDIGRAYAFQSRYLQLHDSLSQQRQSENITLMQARFNAEMKEAEIALLTKEAQLNEEEIKNQKVWLYFSIGCLSLLVILAFVLFYYNRFNSLAKKELEEKNREINSQTAQLKNLNATKDKLFSIISHDLRSPLASLKALMELVGTPGLTHDEFVHVTNTLRRNLDSVHDDLDNLLIWAQTQLKGLKARPEDLDLRLLADEKIVLFREVANNKKISMVNMIDHDTVVVADRNHVGLALRNLLANAIKFNHAGGTITISAKENGNMWEVSVTDSGVGLSEEDRSKLFNAETHFTRLGTNMEKGVGIGLLMTKEFIENNGGSIRVTSELGKGTTFTFGLVAKSMPVPA